MPPSLSSKQAMELFEQLDTTEVEMSHAPRENPLHQSVAKVRGWLLTVFGLLSVLERVIEVFVTVTDVVVGGE